MSVRSGGEADADEGSEVERREIDAYADAEAALSDACLSAGEVVRGASQDAALANSTDDAYASSQI